VEESELNQKNASDQSREKSIKMHVSPDLDYSFRDIANIYVGNGNVTFEFGNHHQAMPGNVTISNRIVLTTAAAYELQQQLQNVLMQAQKKMQMQMQQEMQNKK
jgi:hypothetical protein